MITWCPFRLTGVVLLAVTISLLVACEEFERSVERGARIIERHPELIEDEEDREEWLTGARAARSLVEEIETAEEIAMGQSLAARSFASFGRPHPDRQLQRYVCTVGKLVGLQSDRPGLPYSVAVVQNDKPNALALPGGYVLISTGLLQQLGSESELACVLGHEICHAAQKHGVEIVDRDRTISSLVEFGAALEEDVAEYRQLIDLTYQRLTTEGYDRRYEWRADQGGTLYAHRAGYHPEGLLPLLRQSRETGLQMERYKTHPDPSVRIAKIQSTLRGLGDYAGMPRLEGRYRREVLQKLQ